MAFLQSGVMASEETVKGVIDFSKGSCKAIENESGIAVIILGKFGNLGNSALRTLLRCRFTDEAAVEAEEIFDTSGLAKLCNRSLSACLTHLFG